MMSTTLCMNKYLLFSYGGSLGRVKLILWRPGSPPKDSISMYPRGKGGKSHTADVPPETLDDHFVPPQDEDRCLRGRVIDRGRRRVDGRVIMEKTESTATRPKRNRICRRSHYFHTPRMIRICLCHAEEVNKFVSSSTKFCLCPLIFTKFCLCPLHH